MSLMGVPVKVTAAMLSPYGNCGMSTLQVARLLELVVVACPIWVAVETAVTTRAVEAVVSTMIGPIAVVPALTGIPKPRMSMAITFPPLPVLAGVFRRIPATEAPGTVGVRQDRKSLVTVRVALFFQNKTWLTAGAPTGLADVAEESRTATVYALS
jgi:hypothetical protein